MKGHWMAYMVISFMTCTSMHKLKSYLRKETDNLQVIEINNFQFIRKNIMIRIVQVLEHEERR